MSRVLLVNTNVVKAPYPVPPLGLCLLAERLSSRHEVRVHDGTFRGGDGLVETVRAFAPDHVGLGIRNIDDMCLAAPSEYLDDIERLFVAPLRAATDAPLILGGSGFSLYPEILMRRFGAAWGVAGEADGVFPALLDRLDAGLDADDLPGVLSVRDGTLRSVPATCAPGVLDLPFANIDRWIDFAPYRRLGAYPLQTRRGCAHGCTYCTYPAVEGRAYRLRPVAAIVDEIEDVGRRLPGATIEFVDSTFNDPAGHAESICREIIRRGLSMRLRTMGINPGGITGELFSLMKAAGFAQIDCTPDSASPRVIRAMGKNFRPEALPRAAALIAEHRMPTTWFFLFGGPDEDIDTVRETFAFIDAHVRPDDLVLMGAGLRVYPNTGLHRRAVREGVIAADDPLVTPRFYVSPAIGHERMLALLREASRTRPNCLPPGESTPDPAMLKAAVEMRARDGLDEPMFVTLLRLRRGWERFADIAGPAPIA